MPKSIFSRRQLELGLLGLALGFAFVAIGVRIMDPWAVTILPLAALIIGVLTVNIGGALVGLQFARARSSHRLVLGASGAVAGMVIVGGYLSTVTEFILGPPILIGGLGVAVVIGFVTTSVEKLIYSVPNPG